MLCKLFVDHGLSGQMKPKRCENLEETDDLYLGLNRIMKLITYPIIKGCAHLCKQL